MFICRSERTIRIADDGDVDDDDETANRSTCLSSSFVRSAHRMLLPNVAGSSLLLLLVFLFGIDENV